MNRSNPYGMGFLKQGVQELSKRFVSAIFPDRHPNQTDLSYMLDRANSEIELIQALQFVHTGKVDDVDSDLDDAYHLVEILIRLIGYLEIVQELGK